MILEVIKQAERLVFTWQGLTDYMSASERLQQHQTQSVLIFKCEDTVSPPLCTGLVLILMGYRRA